MPNLARLSPVAILTLVCLGAGARPADGPFLVAILIDNSSSIRSQDLSAARSLPVDLLENLPGESAVEVFTFGDHIHLLAERTSDSAALERSMASLEIAEHDAAIPRALEETLASLRHEDGRAQRVVLLIAGHHDGTAAQLEEAAMAAHSIAIPVFAVAATPAPNVWLEQLAKRAGGEYVRLKEARGYTIARAMRRLIAPQPGSAPQPLGASHPVSGPPGSNLDSWPIAAAFLVLAGLTALLALRGHRLRLQAADRPYWSTQPPPPEMGPDHAPSSAEDHLANLEAEEATLSVVEGLGAGNVFFLNRRSSTMLGGSSAADIPVLDPVVAPRHCEIFVEAGCYVLRDLGTAAGTLVNDRRADRHILRHGDSIRLGGILLVVAFSTHLDQVPDVKGVD